MSSETPSPGLRARSAGIAAGAVLTAVAAVALLGRMFAHAAYLHDTESLMIPTVGRELLHGHTADWIHYQYEVYQGAILVDGALSALGFVLFGDQLLAWHWYSLLYLVGIAVAGMAILRHSSGMAGALVFPMLLAAAPFLIKDGLITPMGHHATGPFFALAALAVALGGRGRGPDGSGPRTLTVGRAFAAGLVLGVGCWYMRTVIAAAPALALAVLPGGRRALGAAAAGFMAYPILTGINCWFFTQHVDPYTEWGFWTTLGASMASPRALAAAVDPVSKSMEALALPFRHLLFAQPFCPSVAEVPQRLSYGLAGWAWTAAMAAVPLGLFGSLVALRPEADAQDTPPVPEGSRLRLPRRALAWLAGQEFRIRRSRRAWGTLVVGVLLAGYAAGYVVSPWRIEPGLTDLAEGQPPVAVGVPGPRYIIAVFLGWSLGIAHLAGLAARGRILRWVAAGVVGTLVLLGGSSALTDWRVDRDPPELVEHLQPFNYYKMYGPHRGPPIETHLACEGADPISRGNHLRAAGWWLVRGPRWLLEDPSRLASELAEIQRSWPLSDEDARFVCQGMGNGLADAIHATQDINEVALIGAVFEAAEALGEGRGDALLNGVAQALPGNSLEGWDAPTVELLCRSTSWGSRPLCHMLGKRGVQMGIGQLPEDPRALFSAEAGPWVEGEVGQQMMQGAGMDLALIAPWTERPASSTGAWPEGFAEAFEAGWLEETTRKAWKPGDPYDPLFVP